MKTWLCIHGARMLWIIVDLQRRYGVVVMVSRPSAVPKGPWRTMTFDTAELVTRSPNVKAVAVVTVVPRTDAVRALLLQGYSPLTTVASSKSGALGLQ